ncbi:MAG: DUF427 domain-containing protein [Janthinobacterium lividum]
MANTEETKHNDEVTAVESVWDYPRPPRLEATPSVLRVEHGGVVIAETGRALRVLETSHPPVFYLPPEDVRTDLLRRSDAVGGAGQRGSFCEWKGSAVYWDLVMPDEETVAAVAWSYPHPSTKFTALRGYLAFYPSRVEACWVDGEQVQAQAGDFYGGWITSRVTGPFKGAPGTQGW